MLGDCRVKVGSAGRNIDKLIFIPTCVYKLTFVPAVTYRLGTPSEKRTVSGAHAERGTTCCPAV